MIARSKKDKDIQAERNRITAQVFKIGNGMGVNDTALLQDAANRAIAFSGASHPLPGMEELVLPGNVPLTDSQVETIINEVITGRPMARDIVTRKATVEVAESRPAEGFTENALRVLEKRYLQKDENGKPIEKPEAMFRRVARHVASAELQYDAKADITYWEERFYKVMMDLDFLPNSPTLMNAGRELGQLSACFVLPVEDSMELIFETVKHTALIHKSGGGTGFSFSRLRPEGDRVGTTGGVASGPISFMRAFDTATDVIKQGGMRRGANMAILNVDHPDIIKFITAKEDSNTLTNFNLSVAITTEFMRAVEKGTDYELINPRTGKSAGKLNATEVFNKIVDSAWRTGDPGIIFIDRINQFNPTPKVGRIESTNPCGEQPLLPYESCNLGSINLSHMLTGTNGQTAINWDRLTETVRLAVRFLDNIIDVNQFPLPQIAEMTRRTRKVGLGVMGFADMLVLLGIPYNSTQGLEIAEKVMRFISQQATLESVELGKERGLFPAFEGSVYDRTDAPRVRNASRTTIAPTGTLSIIAGCSSGIEPLFALSYVRHILEGEEFIEVNPYFERVARQAGFYSKDLMRKLAEGTKLGEAEEVPQALKDVFVTAHDIKPEWHVKMQAAFQRYTDAAVSKTVNFPHDATREDVSKVYMLAFTEGLKGITIYRDRSKDTQVLTIGGGEGKKDKTSAVPAAPGGKLTPRKRPKITKGTVERVNTGCGSLYITVAADEHGICEVFTVLGKTGGCAAAQLEATSRLISLALRSGVSIEAITKHLKGIRCPSIAWEEGAAVLSCADAIGNVLHKYARETAEDTASTEDFGIMRNMGGLCPECGSTLIYQEGCHICSSCGYTKCG